MRKVLLFLVMLILACKSHHPSGLDYFFERAENTFSADKLNGFKNVPTDSVMPYAYNILNDDVNDLLKDSVLLLEVQRFFKYREVDEILKFRFMMYAFHSYLNKNNLNLQQLYDMSVLDYERTRQPSILREIESKMKINWISMKNFNHWIQGDTLLIKLNIQKAGDGFFATYSDPFVGEFKDSLTITGILLRKEFKQVFGANYDFYPSEFSILILKLDKKKYNKFYSRTIAPNDTITIDLNAYKRLILGSKSTSRR